MHATRYASALVLFLAYCIPGRAGVIGVTLDPGYGAGSAANSGTVANPALHLAAGGWARMDVSLPSTGVQRIAFDMTLGTTDTMYSGYFNDWLGLGIGSFGIYKNRTLDEPRIIGNMDAKASNSAPTGYVNPSDLRLILSHRDHGNVSAGYSVPATYHVEATFDYTANTTQFAMSSGGSPVLTHTWPSVFPVTALDFTSAAWTYSGNGGIVDVSNISATAVPEPAALGMASTMAALALRRHRRPARG